MATIIPPCSQALPSDFTMQNDEPGSADWDMNPADLPMSVMPFEFKTTLTATVMSLAEAQGHLLVTICDTCSGNVTFAVAKKKVLLGEIYVNCKKCKTYFLLVKVDVPDDVRDHVEGMRAELVAKWRAKQGHDKWYAEHGITPPPAVTPPGNNSALAGASSRSSSVLVPSTPPPSLNSSAPRTQTLSSPFTPFPSSQRRLGSRASSQYPRGGTLSALSKRLFTQRGLSSPISIGSWESSSPVKTQALARSASSAVFDDVELDSSDIEIIDGPLPMKQTSTIFNVRRSKASGSGSKGTPITVSSSESQGSTPASSSASGSGKRKQDDLDLEEVFYGKKRKLSFASMLGVKRRSIQVVIWYKENTLPLIIAEQVPWIFSIADLTETCAQLEIDCDGFEQLGVWCPDETTWKVYSPQAKISGYTEDHKAVFVRREGLKKLPGFLSGGSKVFA
ncbi:hypothetical protein BDW22DRAFT_1350976 [Trametopsis cervina]|nr:hypothetical protein BDW22DRAFT_1350976 [Trametopsis cervina]